MPAMRALLPLFALAALALAACAEEPDPLAAGRCRTDVDCPGSERCIPEPGDPIGRCGCLEDRHCPGAQTCDREARRCGCVADTECPAGLVCDDGACVCTGDAMCNGVACATDADCPPPATCDAALGVCRAAGDDVLPACACDPSGICVRPRGAAGPYDPAAAPTCNVGARSVPNACGGRSALLAEDCGGADAVCETVPVEPGATCGAGGWGRWTCAGCDAAPRCCVPDVAVRLGIEDCCDPRGGALGCDALAPAAVTDLDGRAVCCPEDHVLDPCGACVGPGDPLYRALVAAIDAGAVVNDPCRDDTPGAAAPVGVWRCEPGAEGPRAVCVSCPAGAPPNACGGCEPLERIAAVDEAIAIEAADIGEPCGGPDRARGFDSACAGTLTCLDARTVYCDAPAPGGRCPGHCGAVEVARAEDAGGGVCLLDGDAPDRACATAGELADAAARTDAGGGAGSLDALRDGAACGPCGDGRWSCAAGEEAALRLVCVGADPHPQLNVCGQCGPPPVLEQGVDAQGDGAGCDPLAPAPGCPCRIEGNPPIPGVLECDAAGRPVLVCVARPSNACGGLAPLDPPTAIPGARCGPRQGAARCESWVWRCQGEDRIVCIDPTVSVLEPARQNACGGCSPLTSDFPAACPAPAGGGPARAPVCLEDRSGEVCIYFDGEIQNTSDQDGRCNCVRYENNPIEPLQTVFGPCFYLVDGDGDGQADERRRCDDDNPDVTDCGEPGEGCCPPTAARRCRDPALACVYQERAAAELCVPCGAVDAPCCDAAPLCPDAEPGQQIACDVERTNTCRPCGSNGEICCDGDLCDIGFACGGDGTCAPCGGDGARCCPGQLCNAGLACAAGTCEPCGGVGGPCCVGRACAADLTCTVANTCAPCGAAGELCCPGQLCDAPLGCSAGLCAACGQPGQLCCAGATPCAAGTACMLNVCVPR